MPDTEPLTPPPETHPMRSRPPSRLGLYLPFSILLLICLVWSGFWFYAAAKTGEVLDQAFEREAKAGRDWTCPDRSVTGFPFRIQLSCSTPTFVSRADGRTAEGAVEGSLAGLQVQARAIEPTRAIATLNGPLSLKTPQGSATLNWKSAQTSVAADTSSLNEFLVDIQELTISLVNGGQAPVIGGLHRLNVNIFQDGAKTDTTADFKIATKIDGLTFTPLDAASGNAQPLTLEFQALASKVPRVPQREWQAALEAWRRGGGGLRISLLDIGKGALHLGLNGDLALDDSHRPTGRLEASFQGLDGIAAQFGARSVAGFVKSGKLPMILTNGKIFVGPVPLAPLLPLY